MWKQFIVQGNTIYLDILPKLLSQYNNAKHSSIKMTPIEASKKKNESTVYLNLKAKQDVFGIEKVIRRDYKKKQALVKWLGYSDDFNSWIPLSSLQNLSN